MSGSAPRRDGRRQFAINAAASWASSLCKVLIQVALLPVMARLLGPSEYGVYALALPTVLFFVVLADGGLGASLSREDESEVVVWSTAFWILLATCSLMAVGVTGSGFVLAWLSGQSELKGIMAFLSLALPLMALSVTADARLVRRGNLLFHSGGDLGASCVGALVAVTLAYHGAGAWALASQYVTSFAVRAAVMNAAAWSPPRLVFDLSSLKGHVSTGGALLASRLGDLVGRFAENALFGHVFGTATLGTYTLANQASRFMCDAVANPLQGAFYAHALQEDDDKVAALQLRLTRVLGMILLPGAVLLAVTSPMLFPLVLGAKWVEAVPMFQAVVVPYSLAAIAWLSGQVLLRHGLSVVSAKIVLAMAALRVGAVAVGFVASPVVVAWLVGGTYLLQAAWMSFAVPGYLTTGGRALSASLLLPASAAFVGGLCSAMLMGMVSVSLPGTVEVILAGGAAYLLALVATGSAVLRSDVVALQGILRHRRAA